MSRIFCYLCCAEIYPLTVMRFHGIPVCPLCVEYHELHAG